eukprot:77446-Pyramimonas_sp.AAC.1
MESTSCANPTRASEFKRVYFLRQTNRTWEVRVYSHDEPIGYGTLGHILMTNQSGVGHTGIFSRRTNRMRDARVYSHDGPIGCGTC